MAVSHRTPCEERVDGDIIAVSPGKFGIAVVWPPLDDAGNSVRAQRAIEEISNALNGNPLGGTRSQWQNRPIHDCAVNRRRSLLMTTTPPPFRQGDDWAQRRMQRSGCYVTGRVPS